MIEIMVATTILIIIVMMVAMVFQQSSLAWQSGIRRSDGNMTLRSLIGILQREMSRAVDARRFGFDNVFETDRVEFVLLTNDVTGPTRRAPRRIVYSYDDGVKLLYRSEYAIFYQGSQPSSEPIEENKVLNRTIPLSYFSFTSNPDPAEPGGLPMVVEIDAAISQEGTFSTIQAWSFGPNGIDEDGGGDDIRSW